MDFIGSFPLNMLLKGGDNEDNDDIGRCAVKREVHFEVYNHIDQNETFIGTGLTHFNNSEVELIKGSKSKKIEKILGYRGKDEVVHRDDLVLEKK